MQVQPTHVFDKLLECHYQASYQRFGFAKYVLKNVKTPSKTVKIWPFLWNPPNCYNMAIWAKKK